jgi:glycosyltransferase involved in cell wall biosynthesis
MDKLLTVSIAAYNVEKYIKEALEPFTQAGVYEYVEVIVIDDGGTDNTYSIAREYEKQYQDTFRVIHKENGGWGSTVNLGIRLAKGKYFKVLDGDDFFDKNTLESFVDVLNQSTADLIYTPAIMFDNQSRDIVKKLEPEIGVVPDKIAPQMHCCAFRTEVLKKSNIRITENCYYTDTEYVLKALINVRTVQFWDKSVYYYRVSREGQSVSISGYRKHYKEHEKVLFSLLEYYNTLKLKSSLSDIFSRRLQELVDEQYRIYLRLEPTKRHRAELIEYDRKIKSTYNQYYNIRIKKIKLLRNTYFIGYRLVAIYETRKRKWL